MYVCYLFARFDFREGVIQREVLTESWTDWGNCWAVDFNLESRCQIIRVSRGRESLAVIVLPPAESSSAKDSRPLAEDCQEVWAGDYVFENEWQSFRTKKDRSIELTSVFHECSPGPARSPSKSSTSPATTR